MRYSVHVKFDHINLNISKLLWISIIVYLSLVLNVVTSKYIRYGI